jgi:transcriptional regulator of heat shock response
MLENMQVSKSASGNGQGGDQQNSELNQAIQQYGDLMGQQRALMDKTLRQGQGNGDPKDGGVQGLAKQQDQVRQKLNQAMQKLGKRGDALGKAGQAMEQAQKSLNGKNLSNASNAENNALQELRKGADALAKEMQAGANSQQAGKEDPLGRGENGPGNMIKLPDANDLARARDILQELRRRAGQRSRPQQELDYLDRLLKEF